MLVLSLHVKHGRKGSGCDEDCRRTREQRRVIDPLGSLLGGCQRSGELEVGGSAEGKKEGWGGGKGGEGGSKLCSRLGDTAEPFCYNV